MCFWFVQAGPDEAVMISGFPYEEGKLKENVIVWYCFQTVTKVPLSVMTVLVETPRVYTRKGVPISVSSVVQVSQLYFVISRAERAL